MELFNSGIWGDALWWLKFGAHDTASNFLSDLYFQVDGNSLTNAQALEFDVFQSIGGYNYMMGTQCDYGVSLWDVWDELDGAWVHTDVSCPKFSPGVWHHIQVYTTRTATAQTYTFVTLVVDGTAYSLGNSYSAKNVGWADNLGVQYQLDVNATWAGYNMWVDNSTLTVW